MGMPENMGRNLYRQGTELKQAIDAQLHELLGAWVASGRLFVLSDLLGREIC